MNLKTWLFASGSCTQGKTELASTEVEDPIKVGSPSQNILGRACFFPSRISKTTIKHSHSDLSTPDIMLVLNFFLTLLSLLIGISSVHADHVETVESTPEIVAHIEDIQAETQAMALIVEAWNGDVEEATIIPVASDSIIKAVKDGTETARKLPKKMSVGKAVKVKRATKKLIKDIEASLGTITGKKLLFDDAKLTSTMIGKIEETKKESEAFIGAIVEKLPRAGKGIGRRLGRKISAAFDAAIKRMTK